MGTVTIAATYGAGGSFVAPAVAERLGLRLIDRAIPVELAQDLASSPGAAPTDDGWPQPGIVGSALLRALNLSGVFAGVPVPPGDLGVDERVGVVEKALRRAADGDGAVILGWAGVFVLQGRDDTLHVRLDASVEARRRQAMRHGNLDEATAAAQQRDADRARAGYIHDVYPAARWEDPRNYHLLIDSTALSLQACVDLIVAAAGDRFPANRPTVSANGVRGG